MQARVHVTRMGPHPNEGARQLWLLVQRLGSQALLAREVGIGVGVLSRWLHCHQKPHARFRAKFQRYGIRFGTWDDEPRKAFSLEQAAP